MSKPDLHEDQDGEHHVEHDGNQSLKKKKKVYLPYLTKQENAEGAEPQVDAEQKKKRRHHKSKDKCEICKERRAKRQKDREERERIKREKELAEQKDLATEPADGPGSDLKDVIEAKINLKDSIQKLET